MNDFELKLVSELLKNSRRSDRELARAIGSSQPTVTRNRMRLEKEKMIGDYTMIPDFVRLGIKIVALTFAVWRPEALREYSAAERVKKAKKFVSNHENVVFASSGRGLGMGRMVVTVHKNYADYDRFMKEVEDEYAGLFERPESFIISLETDKIIAPLSFKNLIEYITKTQ